MSFYDDHNGQGSAEYILLFGAIIIVAIAALVIYRGYFSSDSGLNAAQDINNVRENSVGSESNQTPPANNSTPPPSQP